MAAKKKQPSLAGVEIPPLIDVEQVQLEAIEAKIEEGERLVDDVELAFDEEDENDERPSVNVYVQPPKSQSGKPGPKSIIPAIDTTKKRIAVYGGLAVTIIVTVIKSVQEIIELLKVVK